MNATSAIVALEIRLNKDKTVFAAQAYRAFNSTFALRATAE